VKGLQFEIDTAIRFEELGWSVETTPRSNDYGADLICAVGKEKLIVQCKDYSSKSIGIKAIQEILGALSHYNGTIGALVFRGKVTKQAYTLAKSNNVFIISIADLEAGCIFDRLKKREDIEKAEKNKAERQRAVREEQDRKRISHTKRIDFLYDYGKKFIELYIENNKEKWAKEWSEKFSHDVNREAKNFGNWTSRILQLRFLSNNRSSSVPGAICNPVKDYASYEADMLKFNEQQILQDAKSWALQHYMMTIEDVHPRPVEDNDCLIFTNKLKLHFDSLTKKGESNRLEARARAIRKAYEAGASINSISRRHHISREGVLKILRSSLGRGV
jgi:restriction system protein